MIKEYRFSDADLALSRGRSASPALRRLVTSAPFAQEIVGSVVKPFPGVLVSAWYDTVEQAIADNPGRVEGGNARYLSRENIVVGDADGFEPMGGVKFIAFVKRRADFTPDAFQHYWAIDHAPLVTRTPRLKRYVQSHLLLDQYADGAEPPFDGTAELWFDSVEDFRFAWSSREILEEQYPDSARFIGGGPYICMTHEQILLAR